MNTCDQCEYWQTEPDSNEYPKRKGVMESITRNAIKMGVGDIGLCNRIGLFNEAQDEIIQGRIKFLNRQQCNIFENDPLTNLAFIFDESDWFPSEMLTASKFGCVLFVKK